MRTSKWVAAIGIFSLLAGTAAHADETGIYAGLSVGQSKTDFSDDILNDVLDGKDTAFKIFGGYRILDWLGVETGYVDLGEITQRANLGATRLRVEEAGFDVFGVFYWNIVPTVDLFAKAGLIVSQSHVRASGIFGAFDDTDNSTDPAYGVGAQVHFGKLAFRAEYERFEFDSGNGFDPPEMISVGATWTFF